jgi:hypothetical protein
VLKGFIKEFAAKLGDAEQSAKDGLEKLEIVLFASAFGRGGRKERLVRGEFRPPSPLMKSVRIFSNTHRPVIIPTIEI